MKTKLTGLFAILAIVLTTMANPQENLNKLTGKDETAIHQGLQALLVTAGTDQIQPLLQQLNSPETYDNALFLLSAMASPEADKALYSVLSKTKGRAQAGILNALADRNYNAAAADAVKLSTSEEPVKSAALHYLAKGAGKAGCEALLKMVGNNCPAQLADACLTAAERNPTLALSIYTKLYSTKLPSHIKLATLIGLTKADKANHVKWLNQGLESDQAEWRGAVAKQVASLPDAELQQFLKQINPNASKASGVMLINALTDKNRPAGLDYIRKVLEGPSAMGSKNVAIAAICELGKTEDLEALTLQLNVADAPTAKAIELSLIAAKNSNANAAIIKAFDAKKESDSSYKSLVKIIANRNISGSAPRLLKALSVKNGEIRTIALLALREKAEVKQLPAVFKILNTASTPEEAKAAQKALFTLSKKYPQEATDIIVSIYNGSSDQNKVLLLQAIGIAGDNAALKLIAKSLKESKPEIRNTALRTLSAWKSTAALDQLAKQSKNYPEEKLRVLAQRGYISLCGNITESYQKLSALNKIKSLPMRPQEQKLLADAIATVATAKKMPAFKIKKIGTFRSEACGVADFNSDGKLDIVAGPYIYYAPDWKAFQYSPIGDKKVDEKGKGYYDDFFNLILDINKDGKPDVLTGCWFTQENQWFENSGSDKAMWTRHLIEKLGNHETGKLEDIDGDGKALEFLPHTHITCWYEIGKTPDGKPTMIRHTISDKKNILGAGAGDITGNGRPDIIRPDVWFEAPEDIRKGKWKAHPIELGKVDGKVTHTSNIIVFDVNKDGLNDLLATTAHKHGIFWYEQVRGADKSISWKEHVIDNSWSQAHYLAFADINNDGEKEIITGKRFMAHNGGDPDAFGNMRICCYSFTPGPNPIFSKHTITENEGISAGLNIETVDIDGDGDLDLVTTGKFGGPIILENQLK
ncbi:MAG: hypothetical protein PF904_18550 [Kiritimatiellae bacterium]|jgi:HEAT repeat protein|nr:hypothetical protein [Kiritimatiellia bacterium]